MINPAVIGATVSPYGLPPISIGSMVEPIVVMVLVDRALRLDAFTVIVGVVAVTVAPPAVPMHVKLYVPVPVLVGTMVVLPVVPLPLCPAAMAPPIELDVVTEHVVL